jgi:hypothetical protein
MIRQRNVAEGAAIHVKVLSHPEIIVGRQVHKQRHNLRPCTAADNDINIKAELFLKPENSDLAIASSQVTVRSLI